MGRQSRLTRVLAVALSFCMVTNSIPTSAVAEVVAQSEAQTVELESSGQDADLREVQPEQDVLLDDSEGTDVAFNAEQTPAVEGDAGAAEVAEATGEESVAGEEEDVEGTAIQETIPAEESAQGDDNESVQPAQTHFEQVTSAGVTVTVDFAADAFVEPVELRVTDVAASDECVRDAIDYMATEQGVAPVGEPVSVDISFVNAAGVELEPQGEVEVNIQAPALKEAEQQADAADFVETSDAVVVHTQEPQESAGELAHDVVAEATVQGEEASFTASEFSVYTISRVISLEALVGKRFMFGMMTDRQGGTSIPGWRKFLAISSEDHTDDVNLRGGVMLHVTEGERKAYVSPEEAAKCVWQLERTNGGYRLFTGDGDAKTYLKRDGNNLTKTNDANGATAVTLQFKTDGSGYTQVYVTMGDNKAINAYGGNNFENNKRFGAWKADNSDNEWFYVLEATSELPTQSLPRRRSPAW